MPKLDTHHLYQSPISAPCRAVQLHWFQLRAQTKDLPDLSVHNLDMSKGEHRQSEYLEINPRGCVPCLVTPWGPLAESRAIMLYLADMAALVAPGERAAFGGTPPAPPINTGLPDKLWSRAKVSEWLDWDQGEWYSAISSAVYPVAFGPQDHAAEKDLEKVGAVGATLVRALGDRPFILGDEWTIADISVAMSATLLQLVHYRFEGDLAPISAYMGRMSELPGWWEANKAFDQWRASEFPPPVSSDAKGDGDGDDAA